MRSLWPWVSVLLVSLGAAASPAQTYTINLKAPPAVGKTVTIRDTDTDAEGSSLKFISPDGKTAYEGKPKTRELVYSITPLEPETSGGRPGKYKHVYEKATETVDGKTRKLSYHGRTLVFGRKDGVYRVGVVGDPPWTPGTWTNSSRRPTASTPGSTKTRR